MTGREILFHRALPPSLFVLVAVTMLVFLVIFVPTGEVPDEVAHIMRADSVRHGEIAGFRRPRLDDQGDPAIDAAVRGDISLVGAGFEFFGLSLRDKHETLAHIEHMRSFVWANRLDPVSVPNTAVYPPFFYLPAASGIQLAKYAGYGPYDAILAGRFFNVLAYLALGAAALFFAERGRAMLFAILCLPMSLWLAASMNHDGIVIACSVLAGSLLCRKDPAGQTTARWIAGAAALALAVMAKPFLLPMTLIVPATVPGRFRPNLRSAASGFALAVFPALLWGGAMALFVAVPFVRGPAYPAGPLWSGPAGTLFPSTSPGEQLHILLSVPSRLVTLPLDTLWQEGRWLWHEVIGVLGTLDVVLPPFLYDGWNWILAAAFSAGLIGGRGSLKIDARSNGLRLVALAGAIASSWMIYLLQYLSWTKVGESLIEGVQGRYFIPVAALALPFLAAPLLSIPGGFSLRRALSAAVIVAALFSVVSMSYVVLAAYYLR